MTSSEGVLLRSIRQEGLDLIKSALDRGYSKVELVEAFKAELESTADKDARATPSRVVEKIYGDQASADEFMLRLNNATTALLDKFPSLVESSTDSACSPRTKQNIEIFFANFERIHAQGTLSQSGGDCRWLPYTACLALCTTTGPVWYWVCAYVCYCSFCEGLDGICS